jgi:hypothetical protein
MDSQLHVWEDCKCRLHKIVINFSTGLNVRCYQSNEEMSTADGITSVIEFLKSE